MEVEPDSADAAQAITGLSRKEAGRCATWHLRRLPTAEEWRQAAAVVQPRPYPWLDDGAPAAAEAEIFLVQDWSTGTDSEVAARKAKEELTETILKEGVDKVERLRQQLSDMIARRKRRQEDQWKQLKPRFFQLLETEKKVAELQARKESRAEALEILTRFAVKKGKLAAALKTTEVTPEDAEKAAEGYENELAQARGKLQEVREALQTSTQEQQEEVLELTRMFEQDGAVEAGRGVEEAEAVLQQVPDVVEGATQAALLAETLQAAVLQLGEVSPAFEGVPSLEETDSRTAALDEDIQQLSGEDPAVAEIKDMHQRIAGFSEAMNREFLQEKLLFQELDELVELRARKKAVEAMLNGLKQAMKPEPTTESAE
jgi:uncharacterized phage infection (PIP) family protein YhgE